MEQSIKYTWRQFDKDAKIISKEIIEEMVFNSTHFKNIYGIPRGGLPLAVKLSYLLNLPMILDPNNITKSTIICDDISDTGKTLHKVKDNYIVTIFWSNETLTLPDVAIKNNNRK